MILVIDMNILHYSLENKDTAQYKIIASDLSIIYETKSKDKFLKNGAVWVLKTPPMGNMVKFLEKLQKFPCQPICTKGN